MTDLAAAVDLSPRARHMQHVPVQWTQGTKDRLSVLAEPRAGGATRLDALTSRALLKAGDGDIEGAELDALEAFTEQSTNPGTNPANYIAILNALFAVQRLDIVAHMLRTRYAPALEIEIRIGEEGPGVDRQLWQIDPLGRHIFTFDASLLQPKVDFYGLRHFNAICPLLFNYGLSRRAERGAVVLNQSDIGITPGLSYCDSRPEFFLVPDYVFVPSLGYQYARTHFTNNYVAWSDRSPVAFWRGGTTGICAPNAWQTLERIKLCELARKHQTSGIFDIGISAVAQFRDPATIGQIEASGLVRGRVPWEKWNSYKFLVDIDGNSSPWSNLFQRLLTGSPVLKIESYRGLRQWFYDDLIPWDNFVPIASDASDLVDKIRWLVRHDSIAQRIGQRGRQLALRLTYETELARSIPVITAAFRDKSGETAHLFETMGRPKQNILTESIPSPKYTDEDVSSICHLLEREGFSAKEYAAANKDLAQFGQDLPALVEHLFSHGAAEGRRLAVRDPNHLRNQFEHADLTPQGRSKISGAIANAVLSTHYYVDGVAPSAALINEKRTLEAAVLQSNCSSKTLNSYIGLLDEINRRFTGLTDFRWTGIPYPLYFRAGSTDLQNFKQIFVTKEYGFPLSFMPRRILDLGAYVGFAAIFLAQRFPYAEIVCVEPSVDNFRMLTLNTSAYHNIRRVEAAAWGKSSQVRVDRYYSGDWGAHLVESQAPTDQIRALSLPDILEIARWNDVDLLKCDIEGSELSVFAASKCLIAQMVKCCVVETHDVASPGSSAAVSACFDSSVFSHTRSGEFNVYVRRVLADDGSYIPTLYVLRPAAGLRGIALTEVPRQPWGYYRFGDNSCQLHPTCRGAAPAELETVMDFCGQCTFDCEVSVENPLGFGVIFRLVITPGDDDMPIADASVEVPAGERRQWKVQTGVMNGRCRVALKTEMVGGAPTNHKALANWINPIFRGLVGDCD
jgi:FkbM family methyltransferase